MSNFDKNELFYIAGVGLMLNIFLFAITLLVYLCKPRTENTDDIEALDHLHYLNVPLLQEHEATKGSRLIDLIPAMKFLQVPLSNRGNGCSICLQERYEDDEVCKVLPGCHHVFHADCIDQWLKKRQTCPVCRKIFQLVLPKNPNTCTLV
ncbi:RING-H2 finger protein ATL39-like [Spinacia oleracea]|uniref:RING-type E3 ubiquitin transferase n=1 Tax=Spinacia oleracea TaxID=3562 RepID=A0ABM3RS04_SPIOL|nr:RING-H2 finger protein ATL39-like [Spinacia oleracea]